MYPLHCFCYVVEPDLLFPFCLHVRNCATIPILLHILVLTVFFNIVTSIVVSCLLNVVNCVVKWCTDIQFSSCQPPLEVQLPFCPRNPLYMQYTASDTESSYFPTPSFPRMIFVKGKDTPTPPFFRVRLSFTTRTKYPGTGWLHVTWDFSLTDFPPTSGVVLPFLPVSPSLSVKPLINSWLIRGFFYQ